MAIKDLEKQLYLDLDSKEIEEFDYSFLENQIELFQDDMEFEEEYDSEYEDEYDEEFESYNNDESDDKSNSFDEKSRQIPAEGRKRNISGRFRAILI